MDTELQILRKSLVFHETELFQRFHAHYGFRVRFCNPYASYEKGNVERKVAYVRKNLFVPVPQVNNFNSYNRLLLDQHKVKAGELHYKKGIRIEELFKEDKAAMYLLTAKSFNICRYERFRADGYGKICLDGKHYYSTRPEYSHKQVLAGIYADHIDILDEQGHLLVTHEKIYGSGRTDSSDYSTILHTLMRNPGAWDNSGIFSIKILYRIISLVGLKSRSGESLELAFTDKLMCYII